VVTEEVTKAPDAAVTTSDVPEVAAEPDPKDDKPAAAPDGEKPDATNDQDSAPGDDKQPQPKQRDKRSERRIKRLQRQVDASDRRNKGQAKKISELEAEIESLKAATPTAPEPQLEDFKNPKEFARAYSKWEKDQASADAPSGTSPPPPPPPPPPPAAAETPPPADQEILEFNKAGREKYGDEFLEALQDKGVAVSGVMGEFMLDSELGPDIYLHLANNHQLSRDIHDAKPHEAIDMLRDLEAKGKAGKLDVPAEGELQIEDDPDDTDDKDDKDDKPAGKRKTDAPDPPSETKPGAQAPVKKKPEDMDMDEYAVYRQNQERQRKGLPPI
jgi:hypothetical protein